MVFENKFDQNIILSISGNKLIFARSYKVPAEFLNRLEENY